MSFFTARVRAQMVGMVTALEISTTELKSPGTRDGETGFDDVYTQFLELPGNFYLFDCIQLTPRNLLCIPKGGIEYIYFFTHEVMR